MSSIQSVRFDKSKYTIKQGHDWLKNHGLKLLKNKKVDIAKNFYRFRIITPSYFKHFITKKIADGIEIVIGFH